MDISLKHLKALLRTLADGGVSDFEYQDDKFRVKVSLGAAAPAPGGTSVPPATPVAERTQPGAGEASRPPEVDPTLRYITSPFVGTFYRAPAPGAEPFVQAGSKVKPGQILCIVEAMKLMNEIEAEYPCTILESLVENGESVEFGQKLFQVKAT
jgi:acetyl-CoA carboxylase biotin carboxyl carrier protein